MFSLTYRGINLMCPDRWYLTSFRLCLTGYIYRQSLGEAKFPCPCVFLYVQFFYITVPPHTKTFIIFFYFYLFSILITLNDFRIIFEKHTHAHMYFFSLTIYYNSIFCGRQHNLDCCLIQKRRHIFLGCRRDRDDETL